MACGTLVVSWFVKSVLLYGFWFFGQIDPFSLLRQSIVTEQCFGTGVTTSEAPKDLAGTLATT